MDKLEAAIARGEEASRILNSTVFTDAFEAVHGALVAALEALPTDEGGDDQAKDVRRKLALLSMVRDAITKQVRSAQIAQKTLTTREKLTKTARGAVTSLLNRNRSR